MPFALKFVSLIIAYLVAAKVGLTFGTISSSATVFWPPGGIALAAVLLGGLRYLPAVLIGAGLAAVMVNTPFIFGLGSAIGNVLETYLGYSLLNNASKFNLKFNQEFHQINDLFVIFILGALLPAIASAIIGPVTLLMSGLINADLLPTIMLRWWKSDVLGIVFFTPLILVFAQQRPFFRNAARTKEIIAVWILSISLGVITIIGWSPVRIFEQTPTLSWLFPAIFWAGLRTGRRNTALIQLMFLALALSSAHFNVGLFDNDFAKYGLSNFWAFAMFLSILGMLLAIMSTTERRASRRNAQHAKAFEVSNNGIMITDASNNIISVNGAFTDITGYSAEDVIGKNPRLLSSGRLGREFYITMWKTLTELGHWQGEVWNRHKDGAAYWEQLSIHIITDHNNKVINHIGNFTDITLQKSAQAAIAHQAQHDYLTNLPNRLLFCDRFSQQLAFAARHHTKFAIIYLDLDDFKPVNDSLGHMVGDQLLVAVAERLSTLVREIDTVSRFGGDEFAILVSEVDTLNDVTTLANKVLAALCAPFTLEKYSINVSASLGIALYPDHGADMEVLMNNADTAMYQAKRGGQNQYVTVAN